jgi:transcriptional regulator with XRE-family HTH domain
VPANWMAVSEAVRKGRDELGMQQKELAARSGVSAATIREIEDGKERRRNPRVLRDISVELGWPKNDLEEVLQGRKRPDELSRETETPQGESAAFLAKLVFVLENRIGRVVDVIYNTDSDVDITIEIKHSPPER